MTALRSGPFLDRLDVESLLHLPVDELPFTSGDATAGSEDELQAVVAGSADDCDLPRMIRESKFFHNLARRGASGETPRRTLLELQTFLDDNRHIWEQSWVRFPAVAAQRLRATGFRRRSASHQERNRAGAHRRASLLLQP